jgi:putative endonuclease
MPPSPLKPANKRLKAERNGRWAEAFAAWFLRLQLYAIRARRYKTPVGEIDLIASRFGTTVFVEVKARASSLVEGAALEAVNRQRIVRAAQYFLTQNPRLADTPMRFDVIFLAPYRMPRHVRNAFSA